MMKITRLLLIEDTPADARWLQDTIELEPEGANYRIAWAQKLQTGLKRLSEEQFASVLLDLDLPDSHGLETLHQVQGLQPSCPIVVLSGNSDDGIASQAMQSGAQDYLIKGKVGGSDIIRAVRHAIERKHFELDLERHAREMQALYEASLEINAQIHTDALLQSLVERAARLTDVPMGGLYLLQPDGQSMRLDYAYNVPSEYLGATLKLGEGACGQAAQTGLPVIIDDYAHWEGRLAPFTALSSRRVMAVPLHASGQVIGVINLNDDRKDERRWGEDEVRLVSLFADQAAVALQSTRLLEAERQRSEELARSKAVVSALSQVASRMGETLDPEQILEIMGSELKRLKFSVQISLFSGDPAQLILSYLSFDERAIAQVERLIDNQLIGMPIPEKVWPFDWQGSEHRSPFLVDPISLLTQAFPEAPDGAIETIAAMAGIDHQTGMINLTLRIKDHLIGLMTIWGGNLRESDVPAFIVFANQVAVAIENARLYNRIERQATTDELTGLYNRRGFFLLAEQQLRVAQRTGTQLLLIFIDVDQLKVINDTCGHKEGDMALMETGEALVATFRAADIKARISGDEFAVLAFPTHEMDAVRLMDRLSQEVAVINQRRARSYTLSLSGGYAIWTPGQSVSLDELLARADAQMYQVKRKKTGELRRLD
jgi:diguanylate cyclase (GGDEF)-like protein